MKLSGWKRGMALVLAMTLLLLSGCSGRKNDKDQPAEEAENETTMGRYVEEEISLPEEIQTAGGYPRAVIQIMEDGSLGVLEQYAGLYVSGDQGKTWEKKETPWLEQLDQAYIAHMALAPDGSAAVIYSERIEESEEAASTYVPKYLYAGADGTVLEVPYTDEDDYLYQLWFGRDSRLYGYTIDGEAYEIDPVGGKLKKCFETESPVNYACFTEDYMVAISASGTVVYHLKEERVEEDPVLDGFIREKTGASIGADTGSYVITAAGGEDSKVIYLAFSEGLYRHVIGGTSMEQIADGNLNSLGDPRMYLNGFCALADNEFAVLYDQARLYRYVYDESVPTVPKESVSVYSLKDDQTIRQAISLFQKENPGTYIRYEVGMSGSDGMTKEDAIKNLNTRIMAGEGPDLLVLDGLPEESYSQKGILEDLTELEAEMTGENSLFPNLVDAMRKDGKLYSIPLRFQVPVLMGERASLKGSADLTGLADLAEQLREEQPQGALTGLFMEEQLLYTLGHSSSAAWQNEKGSIDEKALTEFLTEAKRIYQAEIAGYDEEELKQMKASFMEEMETEDQEFLWEIYGAGAFSSALGIAMGEKKLGIGTVKGMDGEFNMLAAVENQGNGFGYELWQGQTGKSFVPVTRLALLSGASEKELASEFFRFCFGRKLQDLEFFTGYPINQSSFEQLKENPYGENEDSGVSVSAGTGEGFFSLDILWAKEEQFAWLKKTVQSLNCIGTGDSMIEQTVYEAGAKVLNGSCDAEEAVKEIVKKVSIYLAE